MCGVVIIARPGVEYEIAHSPAELQKMTGVTMELEYPEDWDTCFCVSDPDVALAAAGWTVVEGDERAHPFALQGDWVATPPA